MKASVLAASVALALAAQAPAAFGETVEARLERLEAQNRALEATVRRHEATIAEQQAAMTGAPERLQALEENLEDQGAAGASSAGDWFRNIEIAGLVEVEVGYVSPYEGDSESDIILATVELAISSQVNDWVEVGVAFLYEEDETDLEVDVAYITLANPDVSPVFLTAGQIYVPFGAYETNLVSDPLTLEIGETRETAAQLGFVHEEFFGSVYVFNGDNKIDGENEIGSWGANLGLAHEEEDRAWAFGAGYISDLGDSDSLHDLIYDNLAAVGIDDPSERTGGWTIHAMGALGPVSLIGEYLSATEEFDADALSFNGKGAKPSAWNIEAGYGFEVMGRESVAAVAYQGTREALGIELPKERWLVGWSVEIFDNTALSFEWAHDSDYGQSDGGTGKSADSFVAQLAVEF
ncbi:LbtU family siderophore porin [Thiococcus pfennigii]|uniref:LbtU family siderophore porin n=1 Tax=Thiococcus pfennigii TaxID=1057 RepID=UPI0019038526|nr:LbtU family siderophore porin [Thiococcus pfennigii]MBK1731421.1 hypothetical protein [Thiococcus pfennigii]